MLIQSRNLGACPIQIVEHDSPRRTRRRNGRIIVSVRPLDVCRGQVILMLYSNSTCGSVVIGGVRYDGRTKIEFFSTIRTRDPDDL